MKRKYEVTYPDTGVIFKFDMLEPKLGMIDIYYPRANFNEQENIDETTWIKEEFEKIAKKYSDLEFLVLLDLTKPGNAELISDEAMDIYVGLLKNKRVKKVATFGQTHWYSILINVMVKLSKTYNKLKYFNDREQALRWLNNEK